jgi:hypothetical protein
VPVPSRETKSRRPLKETLQTAALRVIRASRNSTLDCPGPPLSQLTVFSFGLGGVNEYNRDFSPTTNVNGCKLSSGEIGKRVA